MRPTSTSRQSAAVLSYKEENAFRERIEMRLERSVGQRVDDDVDANGVAAGRKPVEVLFGGALALPGVGHVGVMRRQDHEVAARILNAAIVHFRAVVAAFGYRATAPIPEIDIGYLQELLHVEHRVHDRVGDWQIEDRKLARWQHRRDVVLPVGPGVTAPEVVNPEKPTLHEVIPQVRRLLLGETSERFDVLHEHHGAVEEDRIVESDHDVVRLAVGVELDRDARELGQSNREIVVRAGIIGTPAAIENPAAIEKLPVEVLDGGNALRYPAADPDLLSAGQGRAGQGH